MGSISAGVGLISGIDTASLIEQLLALEARGRTTLQRRVTNLQAQQTALLDVNARLLNFKSAATGFRTNKVFQSATAATSNESVLTGTASAGAQPGTYQFVVQRLVSSHQVMTRGFADRNTTGVGLSELSFEVGRGKLESSTLLSDLNGGQGAGRGKFTITDRSGAAATVDVSTAATLEEVISAINNTGGVSVTARVNGDRLEIIDTSGGAGTLSIADGNGYTTATDLGIATTDGGTGDGDGSANGTIVGAQINRLSANSALSSLNDGNGVVISTGLDVADFRITDRNGTVHDIVLGKYTDGEGEIQDGVTTIDGVVDRINTLTGGAVTAAVAADGVRLELTDTTGGAGLFIVAGGTNGEQSARDLGVLETDGVNSSTISGSRLLAGLNSVLIGRINGGSGLSGATALSFTDRSGASFNVANVDSFSSLSELVAAVNDQASTAGVGISVSLNDAKNGLLVTDTSGGGGNLIIAGDAATALGIETDVAGVATNSVRGTNLQHQYVSGATLLKDLNFGRGIGTGSFRISDAEGESAIVEISSSMKSVQDVLNAINSKGLAINARINDQGDGLLIENTSGTGTLAVRVDSENGSAARDLRLLGEAEDPLVSNVIDGSYEISVDVESTDTLDEVVSKIKASGAPVSAAVLNAGTGSSPFRMTITSQITGTRGDLSIDAGGFGLGLTTLSNGQDARVFFGSSDPAAGVLLSSTTNTLDNVVENVRIDLKQASTDAVTLTVSRDDQKIIDAVKNFVTTFNDVIGRIAQYDSYDQETEKKGPLLGNPVVARLRGALYSTLQRRPVGVSGPYNNLAQMGIKVASDKKGQITLDEAKLREALAENPQAVADLFSAYEKETVTNEEIVEGVTTGEVTDRFTKLGVAELFGQLLDDYTSTVDGVMKTADETFNRRIELTNDRIDAFNRRLESRREFLQRQFAGMESTLARLQGQQGALTQLASLAATASISFASRR